MALPLIFPGNSRSSTENGARSRCNEKFSKNICIARFASKNAKFYIFQTNIRIIWVRCQGGYLGGEKEF